MAEEAKRLPKSFELQSLTGDSSVGPGDLQGKVVVLQFFASWCVGCGDVMAKLAPLTQGRSQVRFMPVSLDETKGESLSYFKRQQKDVQPLVEAAAFDAEARLARSLKIEALPAVLVVDGSGRVLTSFSGHPDARQLREIQRLTAPAKKAAH